MLRCQPVATASPTVPPCKERGKGAQQAWHARGTRTGTHTPFVRRLRRWGNHGYLHKHPPKRTLAAGQTSLRYPRANAPLPARDFGSYAAGVVAPTTHVALDMQDPQQAPSILTRPTPTRHGAVRTRALVTYQAVARCGHQGLRCPAADPPAGAQPPQVLAPQAAVRPASCASGSAPAAPAPRAGAAAPAAHVW